ncbi:Uncharacterised protein [Yersinia frederiksenii]|nr:Uncharacterised protein [Yersinia frederiksenii]CNL55893.1 Uncharacterised protein [Yersinia frederiksenii]
MAKIIIDITTNSKNRLAVDCRCEASEADGKDDLAIAKTVSNGLAGHISIKVHEASIKAKRGKKHAH